VPGRDSPVAHEIIRRGGSAPRTISHPGRLHAPARRQRVMSPRARRVVLAERCDQGSESAYNASIDPNPGSRVHGFGAGRADSRRDARIVAACSDRCCVLDWCRPPTVSRILMQTCSARQPGFLGGRATQPFRKAALQHPNIA
jgi:hypothetical protein